MLIKLVTKLPYDRPAVEALILKHQWNLLETASFEGDVMDFEDGENL